MNVATQPRLVKRIEPSLTAIRKQGKIGGTAAEVHPLAKVVAWLDSAGQKT